MDALKMKLIEELMDHLDQSQGMDLKSLIDKMKADKMASSSDDMSSPRVGDNDGDEGDMIKPKGMKIESIQVMDKPKVKGFDDEANEAIEGVEKKPGMEMGEGASSDQDQEMSDDELAELLKKYL